MRKNLSDFKENFSKCNRCGTCRAYCPVFLQTNNEWHVARGRMALMEAEARGKIKKNSFFKDVIFSCLYCHTCVENCPSRVQVDDLILISREDYIKEKGMPWIEKTSFNTLKNKKTLDRTINILRFLDRYSPLLIKKTFISLINKNGGRIIPSIAKKPLSKQLPERISIKNPKFRIAFFTGCLIEYIYPQIGISLVNLLKNQRIEVIIPKEQYCCGIPLLTSGNREGARFLAKKNVELFTQLGVDYIVNACATCGSTLKDYEKLFENSEIGIRNWADRIYDITEFLAKFSDLKFKGIKEAKVTYHDPCHLKRRQGIYIEPREILKSIGSIDFIEMEEADSCCGGGGLFSFKYYDISKKIAQRKIENAEFTKSDYIVTACPGCILHLNNILNHNKSKQKTIHLIELIE